MGRLSHLASDSTRTARARSRSALYDVNRRRAKTILTPPMSVSSTKPPPLPTLIVNLMREQLSSTLSIMCMTQKKPSLTLARLNIHPKSQTKTLRLDSTFPTLATLKQWAMTLSAVLISRKKHQTKQKQQKHQKHRKLNL